MSSNPLWTKKGRQEEKKGPTPVRDSEGKDSSVELLDLEEGVQGVHEELRKSTISQITLTLLAVLAICYFAKLVLVTIFTSILIAFILEPLVQAFAKIRIPRALGSGIAVLLMLALLYGLSYFFYQRAVDFAHQLPKMSGELRKIVGKYQQNAAEFKKSAQNVIPPKPEERNAVPVRVQDDKGIASWVGGSEIANFGEVLLTIAFIPFLV